MSADYDRLFGPIEGVEEDEIPAEQTARIDHRVAASAPPAPIGPPKRNGHPVPPMPVEIAKVGRRPPIPGDTPKLNGQFGPTTPIVRTPRTPPASAKEPPGAPRRPRPADHHARHGRRSSGSRNEPQPGRPRPERRREPEVPSDITAVRRRPAAGQHAAGGRGRPPTERPADVVNNQRGQGAARVRADSVENKPALRPVPQRGWRRWVHAVTRINPGLSPAERYELDLRTRIRRNPRGLPQIAVLGVKGGAGKTALTVTLGSVFAAVRGDRILVIDADQTAGNLADRAGRTSDATIENLLARNGISRYDDLAAYMSSNAVNLEVLAGQDYCQARHAVNEEDWHRIVDTVSRFYDLLLADCGGGLFDSATRGVLATASGVVIVASASFDGAQQAGVTVDWLRHNGYQRLLDRCCLVINHVVPGKPSPAARELRQRLEQRFSPGRVLELPWDKHIAAGGDIELDHLDGQYRRRLLELAATLSDDFGQAAAR